jgi:hypothetical protein
MTSFQSNHRLITSPSPLFPSLRYLGAQKGEVAVLRIFGVTEDGHSVLAHVHGFTSYFYFDAPPNFSPANCGEVRRVLNDILAQKANAGACFDAPNPTTTTRLHLRHRPLSCPRKGQRVWSGLRPSSSAGDEAVHFELHPQG